MEVIEITPLDATQKLMIESMKIKNEFIKMGFVKRGAFVGAVGSINPKYRNEDTHNDLLSFWVGRYRSDDLEDELIADLNNVVEILRHE